MNIKVACPGCSKRFRVPTEYAGKRVKCPNCETKFAIASIPQESEEYPEQTPPLPDSASPTPQPPIATTTPATTPKKKRISTIVAFIMLGITVLFPIVVVGLVVLGSISEAAEQRKARSGSSDFPGGSIVATENGTFEYKSNSQKKAERAGTMVGIIIGAICFPGVPYIMAMMILAVSYFAFRSAGN